MYLGFHGYPTLTSRPLAAFQDHTDLVRPEIPFDVRCPARANGADKPRSSAPFSAEGRDWPESNQPFAVAENLGPRQNTDGPTQSGWPKGVFLDQRLDGLGALGLDDPQPPGRFARGGA